MCWICLEMFVHGVSCWEFLGFLVWKYEIVGFFFLGFLSKWVWVFNFTRIVLFYAWIVVFLSLNHSVCVQFVLFLIYCFLSQRAHISLNFTEFASWWFLGLEYNNWRSCFWSSSNCLLKWWLRKWIKFWNLPGFFVLNVFP